MKRFVLVVHHDADLYGADQSLLRSLHALRQSEFSPIAVLPFDGPLRELLEEEGIEVAIGPLGKIERNHLRPAGLPRLARELVLARGFLSSTLRRRKVALVYSNSTAVLGGALWANLYRIPHLWHVREIVVHPRLASLGFPRLISWLSSWAVCNSHATRQWLAETVPSLEMKSSVIWNGVGDIPRVHAEKVAAFRRDLGLEPDEVLITLVGRINRWKGQRVFVEAARMLLDAGHRRMRFLVVGDPPRGQEQYLNGLKALVESCGMGKDVLLRPFTRDVWTVWQASQIAVVPSVEPEPFGRVAIEAMACGVPVVASNHGGLAEIVVDGETGKLVGPGDAAALADAVMALAGDAALRHRFGQAGSSRQRALFSQAAHDQELLALIRKLGC